MFAADYPFEDGTVAGRFLDNAAISEPARLKVGRSNAERLLRLPRSGGDAPG
jgi:predicted TIM-barrel fold metal-dependent hydrolase